MIASPRPRTPLLPLFLPLLGALAACGGGGSGPIDGARAYAHVARFVEIGPRPFGSENLAKTADYICSAVEKDGGPKVERQEVVDDYTKKTIRNLYAKIDGPDPQNGPILILGSHYDTKLAEGLTGKEAEHNMRFVGAIDGGGGVGVLIELARELKARQKELAVNVWCYWIDAEESIQWEWDKGHELAGSKAFCKWLVEQKIKPRVKAFVLLDLIGDKNFKIDKDGASDPRLLGLALDAAKAMGQEQRMFEFPTEEDLEPYRKRGIPWGTTDDHNVFHDYGIPPLLLIDFARRIPGEKKDPRYKQWWHTADDDLDQVSPAALAFAGNLVMQMLPALSDFCLGKKK
ncbi:MAG: M28 family peptidase [Planctomycetota bacterium]